jgi:ribosome biogenesis GTPase A
MAQIQWYPGHMAKTIRQIKEMITHVDVIVEVVDARIPIASRNPVLKQFSETKNHLVVFNKADLALEAPLDKWLSKFREKGYKTLAFTATKTKEKNRLLHAIMSFGFQKNRPIRALIVGIPNVGKSTIINLLSDKKKRTVKNMPGVTKELQKIHINDQLDVIDSPGLLWPKFEDPIVGQKLALLGSIKDTILPKDQVCLFGFEYLLKYHNESFRSLYSFEPTENIFDVYDFIGINRGCYIRKGMIDYERVYDLFLYDIRHSKFGPMMLDREYDESI